MTKNINVWWPRMPRPGNFGDILTPMLLKKILHRDAVHCDYPFKQKTLLCVGSIISKTSPNTIVLGSGVIRKLDGIHPEAVFLSVRGPLTRELILEAGGSCPEIYGDPALLLPLIYNSSQPIKYKLGIFPHYVDYELVSSWYKANPDVLVINPLRQDAFDVIDEVLQCERIVSSSLHGIIVAQAYGIPATWVKFSDKLFGDDIKFYDYFNSVNVLMDYTTITSVNNSYADLMALNFVSDIDFDTTPLLNQFNEVNRMI